MSKAFANKIFSINEYLDFEGKSKQKHEYFDGEILLMAGASRRHSRIASNIGGELYIQLSRAQTARSIMVICVCVFARLTTSTDVAIFCGEAELEVYKETETLLNPKVIFEVLSKSTEARDRGDKAEDYRRLASLSDYLFVSQNKMLVEHYSRQNDGSWKLVEYREPDSRVRLSGIDAELLLSDVYAGVQLPKLRLI